MKRLLLFILLSLLFVGCATKSEFLYDYPKITQNNPSGLIVACEKLKDKREKPCEIDEIYEADPIEEIGRIIQQEIMSTGLFANVIHMSEVVEEKDDHRSNETADLLVSAELLEINWEVPDYDDMVGKTLGISVFTGGIGGMIYGSTETEVYGDAKIRIKVIDLHSKKTLLENVYEGHHEEKMKKLKCDTPTTKAQMIGDAIEAAMKKFKEDLYQTVMEKQIPGLISTGTT